jgi:hypothetical protein
MTDKADLYSVTVSRINEGINQSPFETWTAHTISVTPDGSLSISGVSSGRSLSAGLWDGFEVKRLQDMK